MEYKYSENGNFVDLASGRVLYGNYGIPNFPVRLLNEIFRRSVSYCDRKNNLTIYDPCCGGGYSLTVLGFCNNNISNLLGSDIDKKMVDYAGKNTALLTEKGLQERVLELEELLKLFNKTSHREALDSAKRLGENVNHNIEINIFEADCTKELCINSEIDIIITDVPYGALVEWKGENDNPINKMMEQLYRVANPNTVLAVSMDKQQKINSSRWDRLEKQNIGKRKFEIYKLKTV
ncbi:MAG: hypothetical protein K0R00_1840 [Herbinix sp.]|nr:hypothetical protein [Herbinix sp.]